MNVKQMSKLEKSINKELDVNNFRTVEDYDSFEDFMLTQRRRDYFAEINLKSDLDKAEETGAGNYIINQYIDVCSKAVYDNMSRYIQKKARQTNISKFFMRQETYLNHKDELCMKSVKASTALTLKTILKFLLSNRKYKIIDNSTVESTNEIVLHQKVFEAVGTELFEEQIINSLIIQQPDLYKSMSRRFVNNYVFDKINQVVINNKNIDCILRNGTLKSTGEQILNVDKSDYRNDIVKMGAFFVVSVMDCCNLIEFVNYSKDGQKLAGITLNKDIEQKLTNIDNYNSILHLNYLPIPSKFGKPQKWVNFKDGGYKNLGLDFIKNSNSKKLKMSKNWREAFQAANSLQETEYVVNNTVYDTVRYLLNNDVRYRNKKGKLILPFLQKQLKDEMSPLPQHLKEVKADIKKFNKDVINFKNKNKNKKLPIRLDINKQSKKFQKLHEEYQKHRNKIRLEQEMLMANRSKYLSLIEALRYADMMDGNGFYLPVQCDYRQRFYYLPVLNPQTSDNIKGMLNLANKERISTKDELYFFYNCGANDFGLDKEHPDYKYFWIKENIEQIADAGENPLDHIDFWGNADKPFMFLNFCSEVAKFRANNYEFLDSSYITFFDGSCNGTQHLAAITGDENAALLTNLTEDPLRQDLYSKIAVATKEYVLDLSKGNLNVAGLDFKEEHIQHAIEALEQDIDRKLVKQNVMTLVYGATSYGRLDQVTSVYKEVVQNGGSLAFDQDTIGFKSSLVSKLAFEGIKKENPLVMQFMAWLEEVSDFFSALTVRNEEENIVSFGSKIKWTTPNGCEIEQKYNKVESDRVSVKAGSHRFQFFSAGFSHNSISKSKMKNGIIPNIVHSLDACHMALTINACSKYFNDFVCVHDSFGCNVKHASKLYQIVRETFISMYSEINFMEELYKQFKAQVTEYDLNLKENEEKMAELLPKPPIKGSYDIERSRASVFSFI